MILILLVFYLLGFGSAIAAFLALQLILFILLLIFFI